ncbi:hypothetical protein LQW54_008397 [Pestalotiopsis sp. IQ-011]
MDWYSDPKSTARADWAKQDVAEDIVDAYGHISVRHPQKRDVYIMSGYMAPALVKSSDDLIEYYVKDSSTVDPNAKKGCSEVPVFDIGDIYEPGDQQDMLIRNARLGTALAKEFSRSPHLEAPPLDHTVVLMKRHGYTTHGADVETAVYRAIYTKVNAGVQTSALLVGNVPGCEGSALPKPMPQPMLEGCQVMNEGTQDKPWGLWVAEVENNSLYVNKG